MKITMRRNEAYRFYSLFREGEIICFDVTPPPTFGFSQKDLPLRRRGISRFFYNGCADDFTIKSVDDYKILVTFV